MKKYIILILLGIGVVTSCRNDIKPIPPCTTTVESQIRLPLGYLGFCAFGDGGPVEKPLRVKITIEGIKEDSNGIRTDYLDSKTFNVTNIKNGGNDNLFSMNLPSCGSYV